MVPAADRCGDGRECHRRLREENLNNTRLDQVMAGHENVTSQTERHGEIVKLMLMKEIMDQGPKSRGRRFRRPLRHRPGDTRN